MQITENDVIVMIADTHRSINDAVECGLPDLAGRLRSHLSALVILHDDIMYRTGQY